MGKANCPSLQKSLGWCEGMPSQPGVRRRVYFCSKNLIVAFPTLQRDEFRRPSSAILQGDFELAEGAFWQYLDINIDKSTVTSDPQGERPSQTQLNKATFVHNGIDEDATAAAGWLNNSDNVYVYEDMVGRFRVLGNERWNTITTVNQDQGQGTNPASTTISVEVTDEMAAPFYNGPLETEDGTVYPDADASEDGSNDEPTVLPSSITLKTNNTYQLRLDPETGWTFEVNNELVSVSETGLVTAGNTAGNATITCTHTSGTVVTVGVTVMRGL